MAAKKIDYETILACKQGDDDALNRVLTTLKNRRNPNKNRKFVLGFCWVFDPNENALQHFRYKNKRKACIQARNA